MTIACRDEQPQEGIEMDRALGIIFWGFLNRTGLLNVSAGCNKRLKNDVIGRAVSVRQQPEEGK